MSLCHLDWGIGRQKHSLGVFARSYLDRSLSEIKGSSFAFDRGECAHVNKFHIKYCFLNWLFKLCDTGFIGYNNLS